MKIRIRDNSIRLRLAKGEVEAICDTGSVRAFTGFPGGRRFAYSLESSPACVSPSAGFAGDEMSVRLPESTVVDWADSEQVSISGELVLDSGEMLSILVEKDFACLAPRPGEDESDMYPHPNADTAEC